MVYFIALQIGKDLSEQAGQAGQYEQASRSIRRSENASVQTMYLFAELEEEGLGVIGVSKEPANDVFIFPEAAIINVVAVEGVDEFTPVPSIKSAMQYRQEYSKNLSRIIHGQNLATTMCQIM